MASVSASVTGNGDQHNAGFAPSQGQRNQQRYGKRGEQQVLEQFVGFILGGFAIVAGDADVQIVGNDVPAQRIHILREAFRR